jgi:hypothetical protein
LIEPYSAEERARIDEELALPIGVTGKAVEDARTEWLALQGW